MSPDIEWRIGEESEQETVVKTQSRPPSRVRRVLIGVMLALGTGLGIAYSAIPAPPTPAPMPTPSPTSTAISSPPLNPVIDREAHALATGDKAAFMALQDQVDGQWYRAQQAAFKPWGTPPNGRLYIILDQGHSANGRAWAEVMQWFNIDSYVRETRFYQLRKTSDGPEWKRARPDLTFWSGTQLAGSTAHFNIISPIEDNQQAWSVIERFERVYDVLCRDLNCPSGNRHAPAISLIFDPTQATPIVDTGGTLTITLPSPRVAGYRGPAGIKDDKFITWAYQYLLPIITRLAAGDTTPRQADPNGEWYVQGIIAWESLRIELARDTPLEQISINAPGELWPNPSQGGLAATRQFYRELLSDAQLVALRQLWYLPIDTNIPSQQFDVIDGEIDALIAYLEEVYHPIGVVKFLNALGPARSLDQAIETALNVKYADFEQQWLNWLGK